MLRTRYVFAKMSEAHALTCSTSCLFLECAVAEFQERNKTAALIHRRADISTRIPTSIYLKKSIIIFWQGYSSYTLKPRIGPFVRKSNQTDPQFCFLCFSDEVSSSKLHLYPIYAFATLGHYRLFRKD
jgi:hypothetical protein